MKLGQLVQIVVGVSNIAQSQAFYERLGFRLMKSKQNSPAPRSWAQLSDGQYRFLLCESAAHYVGVRYLSPAVDKIVRRLEDFEIPTSVRRGESDAIEQATFYAPSELRVEVAHMPSPGAHPPKGEAQSRCGKFGEFAVPVSNVRRAIAFWEEWGFYKTYESQEPYPWAILNDGMMVLGLHQVVDATEPFEFTAPTPTYFAVDMAERIDSLRSEGVPFFQEMTDETGHVANAILQAPGGERIFLFQGGM